MMVCMCMSSYFRFRVTWRTKWLRFELLTADTFIQDRTVFGRYAKLCMVVLPHFMVVLPHFIWWSLVRKTGETLSYFFPSQGRLHSYVSLAGSGSYDSANENPEMRCDAMRCDASSSSHRHVSSRMHESLYCRKQIRGRFYLLPVESLDTATSADVDSEQRLHDFFV